MWLVVVVVSCSLPLVGVDEGSCSPWRLYSLVIGIFDSCCNHGYNDKNESNYDLYDDRKNG